MTKRLEPPLEHPVGLTLFQRYEPNDLLIQPARSSIGFDVGNEPPLVFAVREGFDFAGFSRHDESAYNARATRRGTRPCARIVG